MAETTKGTGKMSFLYEVKSIYELPGGYLFYAYYTDEDNITTGICENHLIKVKDVHQFHYVGERCKWNIPLKIKYIWLILWG